MYSRKFAFTLASKDVALLVKTRNSDQQKVLVAERQLLALKIRIHAANLEIGALAHKAAKHI